MIGLNLQSVEPKNSSSPDERPTAILPLYQSAFSLCVPLDDIRSSDEVRLEGIGLDIEQN